MFANRFRRLALERLEIKLTMDGAALSELERPPTEVGDGELTEPAAEVSLDVPNASVGTCRSTDSHLEIARQSADALVADSQDVPVSAHELGHTLGFRHEHTVPSESMEEFDVSAEGDSTSLAGIRKATDVTLKRGLIGDNVDSVFLELAEGDGSADPSEPAAGSTYFDGRFLTTDDLVRD